MTEARIPPYSEEAEHAIVGCIVVDAETALGILAELKVPQGAFHIPAVRTIVECATLMQSTGRVVDATTLTVALRGSGKLDAIGGARFLDAGVDSMGSVAHCQYYAEIVLDKWHLREIIRIARDAEAAAYESADADQTEEVRSLAEFNMASLDGTAARRKRTPTQIMTDQAAMWRKASEVGCAGLPTGFRFFDKGLGGLLDSGIYYISGKAGSCKTTLVRQIIRNVAMRGIPVGAFSLEQTEDQLWGSILATQTRQSVYWLNAGNRFKVNLDILEAGIEQTATLPIHIDDRPHTLSTVWGGARRMVAKGCRLIVLDYIQRLSQDRKYSGIEEWMTACSGTMTSIAKTLHVPVMVVSALNNDDQLRGSRMLDYDAWAHVRLEKGKGDRVVKVHVEKQRFGPICDGGDLELDLNGNELMEVDNAEPER